jgi:hypothetical protein
MSSQAAVRQREANGAAACKTWPRLGWAEGAGVIVS